MKYTFFFLLILFLLLAFLIAGCTKKSNTNKAKNKEIQTSKNAIDFYDESILTHVDAEELCEFNFDFFLLELNQKLASYQLELTVQKEEGFEESFEVSINGRKVKLYDESDFPEGKYWDVGPRNFFRTVNNILKGKNIDKQFYLLYGGNDLHTVFLNREQFELMSKSNKDNKNEIPYLP